MTGVEFSKKIAEKAEISYKLSAEILAIAKEVLVEELGKGESFNWMGVCKITPIERPERISYCIHTKQKEVIPAKKKLKANISTAFETEVFGK